VDGEERVGGRERRGGRAGWVNGVGRKIGGRGVEDTAVMVHFQHTPGGNDKSAVMMQGLS
jgi:hypothetical protein